MNEHEPCLRTAISSPQVVAAPNRRCADSEALLVSKRIGIFVEGIRQGSLKCDFAVVHVYMAGRSYPCCVARDTKYLFMNPARRVCMTKTF